jgi:hypothetical protein
MSRLVSLQVREAIRQRDQYRCVYCHSPEELSVTLFGSDHIVPLSSGGSSDFDNLCLACATCNRFKATRQEAVDPHTGSVVSLFHPRLQSWTDHFQWNNDDADILGVTPVGRATIIALRMNRPQLSHLRRLWRRLGYRLD